MPPAAMSRKTTPKYLLVDTATDSRLAQLGWLDGDLRQVSHQIENKRELYRLLLKIDRARLEKIDGIIVVSGPGEFSAVRQGVVFANALAWSLKVPLAGLRIGGKKEFPRKGKLNWVDAEYLRPPNITSK